MFRSTEDSRAAFGLRTGPAAATRRGTPGGSVKSNSSQLEVEADPGIQDKRLLLYEPEFANVLKQTERQGNTASVVLRQAWDGTKTLRTLTKNSPACATAAHISLVGHITQQELQRYL